MHVDAGMDNMVDLGDLKAKRNRDWKLNVWYVNVVDKYALNAYKFIRDVTLPRDYVFCISPNEKISALYYLFDVAYSL